MDKCQYITLRLLLGAANIMMILIIPLPMLYVYDIHIVCYHRDHSNCERLLLMNAGWAPGGRQP